MKKTLFLLSTLMLGTLAGTSAVTISNATDKPHSLDKRKDVSNCRPRITVEHFECDGSGEASIKASFKHLSIKTCGGPYDFYWKKPDSEITPIPLTDLLESEYTVTEPGAYNLVIQDGIEVLFDIDIDVGYKYDWEESESAFSEDFDIEGYNDIEYTQVLMPDEDDIYYPSGKGEGVRLPVAQTGWFEFDVENLAEWPTNVANLNWSNYTDILTVNIGMSVSGSTLTYNTFIAGGTTITSSIPLDDLDGFKIRRTDTNFEVYMNANDEYTLIHTGTVSNHTMNAFLKLTGLKIVNTYCSYPCSVKELTLFAPMRRNVDGELHVMSVNEVRVIYNEAYATNSIQKLELVKEDEILDITDQIPLNGMGEPNVRRGDNRWIIPMATAGIVAEDVCLLRLTNIKDEIYYLRVKFQDTD